MARRALPRWGCNLHRAGVASARAALGPDRDRRFVVLGEREQVVVRLCEVVRGQQEQPADGAVARYVAALSSAPRAIVPLVCEFLATI